jgi:two-component system chemotaxis response regulator CheB
VDKIKVLVVDDSAFMQRVINSILKDNERIEIAAVAGDGAEALEILKQKRIDVVTMDVEMPGMNGLEALKAIIETRPTPVIMISSHTKRGAVETIQSLDIGAVDFITKPSTGLENDLARFGREIKQKIAVASTARLIGRRPGRRPVLNVPKPEGIYGTSVRYMIAIGSSTGGPKALQRVLPVIPGSIAGAVMVVQHMPAGFTKSLAERLDTFCQLKVREAKDRELVKSGHCYIAPGGCHMRVNRGAREREYVIRLDEGPVVSGHRPSVDVLFESLSRVQIEKMVAVIMTGMGSDGSAGLAKLKEFRGCPAIAQNEESSIVFGMPGTAIKNGLIDKVADLDSIGEEILKSLEV